MEKVIGCLIAIVVVSAIEFALGFVLMTIWNAVLPERQINIWVATGIFFILGVLFKSAAKS